MKVKWFGWSDLITLGFLAIVIACAVLENYFAMFSALGFGALIVGFKLYRFIKNWDTHKSFILENVKLWEVGQLGHHLDDKYWEGKKRPTFMQKIKGVDPNKEEVIIDIEPKD